MKLTDFVGNGEMLEQLMRSARAGRIVHALLFAGASGAGKRTAAKLFVQALYCTGAGKPCGACPACRRVAENTHPDVHVVRPDGRSILVEQIRALIDAVSAMPYEGGFHTVIIEQADKMTDSAQNALLKTLENPVVPVMFFLLSESVGGMLPTVQSRCQIVRFRALTTEECKGVLLKRGMEVRRAELLAGLSGGSVGRALEMDADEEYFPLRERVIKSLKTLKGPGSVAAAAFVLSADKEKSGDVLEIMETLARDRMAVENGAPAFGQEEAVPRIPGVNGETLLMGVMEMRRKLRSNVSWQNALEEMYFRICAL